MTLLEATVIILVLLSLISSLFIGAQAWKNAADRAMCIVQIQNVQKGVRCYSNLYGLAPGEYATNLRNQVIGFGRFIETTPICPSGGDYTFGATHGADTIPPIGALYMECDLATPSQHLPIGTADW